MSRHEASLLPELSRADAGLRAVTARQLCLFSGQDDRRRGIYFVSSATMAA
jgi:hypothetical protein